LVGIRFRAKSSATSQEKTTLAHDCILGCFFHEPWLTFYVIDIKCWQGNLYNERNTSKVNWKREWATAGKVSVVL